MPRIVAPSVSRSEQMGTALFPFHMLVLNYRVFFEGGLCSRVVGVKGINSLAAQPGFAVGALISSG